MIKKLALALLLTSMGSGLVLAAASLPTPVSIQDELDQQDFTKKTAQEQIDLYRKIYDLAYKEYQSKSDKTKDLDSFHNQHIPGLSKIMTDALNMTEKFVSEYVGKEEKEAFEARKYYVNSRILNLKKIVVRFEEDKKLSLSAFYVLNQDIAVKVDVLKGNGDIVMGEESLEYVMYLITNAIKLNQLHQPDYLYWDAIDSLQYDSESFNRLVTRILHEEAIIKREAETYPEDKRDRAIKATSVAQRIIYAANTHEQNKRMSKAIEHELMGEIEQLLEYVTSGRGKFQFLDRIYGSYKVEGKFEQWSKLHETLYPSLRDYVIEKNPTCFDNYYKPVYEKLRRKPGKIGDHFISLMIIYSGESLSVDVFNKQRFGYDYESYIAQFDVSLEQPANKKCNPHWGMFHTTSKMLQHDFAHLREQLLWENVYFNFNGILFYDKLKEIYDFAEVLADENARRIVKDGLFVLSHEFQVLVSNNAQIYSLFTRKNFSEFISITKGCFQLLMNHPRTEFYKRNFRDMEFILKSGHDEKGDPFIQTFKGSGFTPEKKQDLIYEGYIKFWDAFKKIIEPLLTRVI